MMLLMMILIVMMVMMMLDSRVETSESQLDKYESPVQSSVLLSLQTCIADLQNRQNGRGQQTQD